MAKRCTRELVNGGKINQFRWVGSAGEQVGRPISPASGKIDTWTVISPEGSEPGSTGPPCSPRTRKRFEALLLTKAELDAMGPARCRGPAHPGQTGRGAGGRSRKTCKDPRPPSRPTTLWIHLENQSCRRRSRADAIDAKMDLVSYRHGAILYQDGNGQGAKHDWIQTGELIQVGQKRGASIQGPDGGNAASVHRRTRTGAGRISRFRAGAGKNSLRS